jgi:hypothetical protein
VGGTSGQAGEHWGVMVKFMDVQAAPDGGLSRLSTGRRKVVHGADGNQRRGSGPWLMAVACWVGVVRCASRVLVTVLAGSDGGRRWGGTGKAPRWSEELGVRCFREGLRPGDGAPGAWRRRTSVRWQLVGSSQ